MITDIGNYYIYRHIRLDKNEPFYVGIGTKVQKGKSYSTIYKRAFAKGKRRGKIWRYITAKTDYKVQILMESENYNFLLKKETELIKLYGRIDLKTGILSNLTDGGEGAVRYKHTKEALLKLKINSSNKGKKCKHFNTGLEFDSLSKGCLYFNMDYKTETNRIKKQLSNSSFYFINKPFIRNRKKIRNKITNEIYYFLKDLCNKENISYYGLWERLQKNTDKIYEYIN